jgi:hypothetical protein
MAIVRGRRAEVRLGDEGDLDGEVVAGDVAVEFQQAALAGAVERLENVNLGGYPLRRARAPPATSHSPMILTRTRLRRRPSNSP